MTMICFVMETIKALSEDIDIVTVDFCASDKATQDVTTVICVIIKLIAYSLKHSINYVNYLEEL